MEPPKFILSRASSSILNRKGYSECTFPCFHFFFPLLLKRFIYLFLEMGEGREKERERNIRVWLPLMHPLLGTWPTTQACALTGNRTSDPLLYRLVLNPLSHTSHGFSFFLIHYNVINTCLISCVPETLSPIHSSFRAHPYNFH